MTHAFDHSRLADALLPAVLAAGDVLLRHFRTQLTVERKADASPVTAADRAAEAVLLEALARAAPGVPVIAEEAVAAGQIPDIGDAFFLVDALDGTREFIAGGTEFTVNVGFVTGGVATFGMVFAPILRRLYATPWPDRAVEARPRIGAAASRLADLDPSAIRTRPPDPAALTALVSRSHTEAAVGDRLAQFARATFRPVASSLKFCLVARGEADLYPRLKPTSEWDTAAGHAILGAAGGIVTTLDGLPLEYGKVDRHFENPAFVAWGRAPAVDW
ncbi:MAG: 3'(2'),5'-bisphosphate nucleotidase CysQ [Hyphomicrobiaceae bacterium]